MLAGQCRSEGYSVTASTMTLTAPPESVPPTTGVFTPAGGVGVFSGPIGGVLFDLIDVVRAFDAVF